MNPQPKDPKSSNQIRAKFKAAAHNSLERAVKSSHVKNFLLAHKPSSQHLIIGKYCIVRHQDQTFSVIDHTKKVIHSNLYLFGAALAIVENLNCDHTHFVEQVVDLEKRYCQLYTELELLKRAAQNNSCLWPRVDIIKEKLASIKRQIHRFVLVQKLL